MKNFFIYITMLAILAPSSLMAADKIELGQVVVTATRTEEALESVTSSVTVITAEDIENKQATTVMDALRDVSGIDVSQSGGPGKTASIYIRGGEAHHTLVMIDGVQANSPTLGSFNFADLNIDNIERIEVIRGPQSTLYGSDAMAGVINIITKKGRGATKITLSAEAGSYSTYRESASVSGGTDNKSYSLSFSRLDTDGFSATSEDYGNTEDDGYENSTFSARMGYRLNDSLDMDLTLRYIDTETDLDGSGVDDPDYMQKFTSLVGAAKLNHVISDMWDHSLKLSLAEDDSENIHVDPSKESNIETRIKTVDWQHNIYLLDETNTMTFGLEHEKQEGRSESDDIFDKALSNRAYYLQNQLALLNDDLQLVAGVRRDDHSDFEGETTYKVSGSYFLQESSTRFRGSYGTAFKSPTFNDLYWPYQSSVWGGITFIMAGNEDLKAEKGRGYDIGVSQELLGKRLSLDVTYFNNTLSNLIDWASSQTGPTEYTYEPRNVSKTEVDGWEFGLSIKPTKSTGIKGTFTISDSEDQATGKELDRRPKHKGNLALTWRPEGAVFTASYRHVGHRWDKSHGIRLSSYSKIDISASYELSKNLGIFGRVENMTDRKYEEAIGGVSTPYGVSGRSYYAGLKASF